MEERLKNLFYYDHDYITTLFKNSIDKKICAKFFDEKQNRKNQKIYNYDCVIDIFYFKKKKQKKSIFQSH